MLQFTRGEALRVHVRELLQLERAFEGDREADVPTDEQHGSRGDQLSSQLAYRFHHVEHGVELRGNGLQLLDDGGHFVGVLHATYLCQVQADQVARDELGEERLGGRDRDLRSATRVQHGVRLARNGRTV